MRPTSTVFIGIAVALAWTLILNASTLLALSHDTLTIAGLYDADEPYYFSLINDASEGYINLGHSSLKEHRDAFLPSSYTPLIQGGLKALFGWDMLTTILVGDFLFPFIATLIVFLALRRIFSPWWISAAVSFLLMDQAGVGMHRTAVTEVTHTIVLMYICIFLVMQESRRQYLARGLTLGVMVYSHIIHTLYFLSVEGLDAVRRLVSQSFTLREKVLSSVYLSIPFLLLIVPRMIISFTFTRDPKAAIDTHERLGLIHTHYPAAPKLQLIILITIGLLLLAQRRGYGDRVTLRRVMFLAGGGLIALNQSLIHGLEAGFFQYYSLVVKTIIWLAFSYLLYILPWKQLAWAFLVLLSVYYTSTFIRSVGFKYAAVAPMKIQYEQSGLPELIPWLEQQEDGRIIAAPLEIADAIPSLTKHYVLFDSYARHQMVTVNELAKRYVLHRQLFSELYGDPTHHFVFGTYAGGLAARAKLVCRLKAKMFGTPSDKCSQPIEKFIHHTKELEYVNTAKPDPRDIVNVFHVDLIIIKTHLPAELQSLCTEMTAIKQYHIYRCQPES